MEANFQNKILEDQIRECYGRLVWTYTTHQKCADILENKSRRIKFFKIALNSISATGLISYIITNQVWLPIITIVFTTLALFLDIYTLSYDIDKEINLHIDMINKLWNIRESYLSLLVDIKNNNIDITEIMKKRDEPIARFISLITAVERVLNTSNNRTTGHGVPGSGRHIR